MEERPYYIVADYNCQEKRMNYLLCNDNDNFCEEFTASDDQTFWQNIQNIIETKVSVAKQVDFPVIIQNFFTHGAVFLLKTQTKTEDDQLAVQRISNTKNSFIFVRRNYGNVQVRCFDASMFLSRKLEKIKLELIESKISRPTLLQLKDWLGELRRIIVDKYGKDPFQNYTLNVFTFNRMKEKTEVDLSRIRNPEAADYFKDYVRPGVGSCNNRIVEIDKSIEWIVHLDANNLAGWAMSDFLPDGDIIALETDLDSFTKETIENLADQEEHGYIFEVDLDYPETLYNSHDDLPFCPEYKQVNQNVQEEKFIACLGNKTNYVIHCKYLILALSSGLILKKVHKVWEFYQSKWLKKYIDMNTEFRNASQTDFEKFLFKQMNNVLVGKLSPQKRMKSPLASSWEEVQNILEKSGDLTKYIDRHIINENLCLLEFSSDAENTYSILAFTINDLMKYKMYDFHYNCMKKKYGDDVSLLYTETDSFIYKIKTGDFYQDLVEDADMREYFDTTGLEKRNVPIVNAKKLGKMKDEQGGTRILEFLGAGLKYYYLELEDSEPVVKIFQASSQEKQDIKKADFKESILNEQPIHIRRKISTISGAGFDIVENDMAGEVLVFDGKRKLNRDLITTRAYRTEDYN